MEDLTKALPFPPLRIGGKAGGDGDLLSGGDAAVIRRFPIAACFLGAGCASTQLNYNTADLASSLSSLASKTQDPLQSRAGHRRAGIVPSEVTISTPYRRYNHQCR